MRELADLAARLAELGRTHAPAALATVARVEGSSYRREGARMLIETDGRLTGMLTGGCLERDLAALAGAVLDRGEARVEVFDLTAEEEAIWGTGTGCAGRMTILLEPLDRRRRAELAALLARVLEERREVRLATVVGPVDDRRHHSPRPGTRLRLEDGDVEATHVDPVRRAAARGALLACAPGRAEFVDLPLPGDGTLELLIESILPPIHLLVIGAERDAPPLLRLARELGWATTVVEPRATDTAAARVGDLARLLVAAPRALAGAVELSGRTAVLLATHRYLDDLAFLEALAGAPVAWLGLLGPVRRRERLLGDLARRAPAAAEALRARLRGPAGLALGGRAPGEVALSVIAEIQAVFAGGSGLPLGPGAGASVETAFPADPPARRP
jgi:xanthine dehydrogenase accessory factor